MLRFFFFAFATLRAIYRYAFHYAIFFCRFDAFLSSPPPLFAIDASTMLMPRFFMSLLPIFLSLMIFATLYAALLDVSLRHDAAAALTALLALCCCCRLLLIRCRCCRHTATLWRVAGARCFFFFFFAMARSTIPRCVMPASACVHDATRDMLLLMLPHDA